MVSLLIIALAWGVAIDRLRAYGWHPRDEAGRTNCSHAIIFAAAATAGVPAVYRFIDRIVGIPNIALLVQSTLFILGMWQLGVMVNHLEGSAGGRLRWTASGWLAATTVLVLAVIFPLMPTHQTTTGDFTGRYGNEPFVLEYVMVLMAYLGLLTGRFCAQSFRSMLIASRELITMRRRLGLYGIGWALGTGAAAHEVIYCVMRRAGVTYPPPGGGTVRGVLINASFLFLLSGIFFEIYEWWARYRTHRRLYPLWFAMVKAVPEIELKQGFPKPKSALADSVLFGNMGPRLLNRVSEITDGANRLRSYVDAGLMAQIESRCERAGLQDGDKRSAVAMAEGLKEGATAKVSGRRAQHPISRWPAPNGKEVGSDIPYLAKVAEAYRSDGIASLEQEAAPWGARQIGG